MNGEETQPFAQDKKRNHRAGNMSPSMASFFNKYVQETVGSAPPEPEPATKQRVAKRQPQPQVIPQATGIFHPVQQQARAEPRIRPKIRVRLSRRAVLVTVCLTTVALLIGTGAAIIRKLNSSQPDPIPISIREAVNYPLYYSRKLPGGFRLNPANPPRLLGRVTTLRYIYKDHSIVMNMQPKPSIGLPEPFRLKDVSTAAGPGYVANIDSQPAGIVEGDKTLIFITSEDKLDVDTFVQFMHSLGPAD